MVWAALAPFCLIPWSLTPREQDLSLPSLTANCLLLLPQFWGCIGVSARKQGYFDN